MDLATPRGILVLAGPGGTYHREIAGDSRVSQLFVAAGEIMSEAGTSPGELGLMGVGRGPGSFTGVRVAVTAAKITTAVLDLPLVAPDSLMVTAAGAGDEKKAVFVAVDARRGEVYYALYRLDGGYPAALMEPCVAPPEAAATALSSWLEREGAGIIGVGNGIDAYPRAWPVGMEVESGEWPEPEGLARLCRLAAARGECIDPVHLLPLYLRRPDALWRYGGHERGSSC
jgi:tRNA threonylcarbamoyladenosine biosynthesis protein TsaB